MSYIKLIVRNAGRNPVRSLLTALVTIMLVFVVTIVWSMLWLLDAATAEKSQNFRALVTERWAIPSQLPFSYAGPLSHGAARESGDVQPSDWMTWQFYGGTLDPTKLTREGVIFAIACDPEKLATMMDGLDDLPGPQAAQLRADIAKLKANRQGIIIGRNHLSVTNKRIGERFKLTGSGAYKGIDLDFEIVGVFPTGRYDTLAAFNCEYFNSTLDAYPRQHNGQKHPLAERSLNLVWLQVPDTATFGRLAKQIEDSPEFSEPALKCETGASGIASFLEAFHDLIWGMRWLLVPACLVTILLVIANAISISVRHRRQELAMLKVLGFRPFQILILVLGESLLLGAGAGLISAGMTYGVINWGLGGISFPIAFFDRFMIPSAALWWGPAVGGLAALLGSFLPAWSACSVRVADVLSKVA